MNRFERYLPTTIDTQVVNEPDEAAGRVRGDTNSRMTRPATGASSSASSFLASVREMADGAASYITSHSDITFCD